MDQVWVVIMTKDGDVLRRLPVFVEMECPDLEDVNELAQKITDAICYHFVTEAI